ncbi:bifunctional tRNA (5-methylaminomethyl-2-thiouridine)(34)-methyltransferase MnmD/FAD-dependent 5-carboxymethylaminomethyl-2-thiouridine(34) oxidoreductase MnmC [Ferrimonas pelagia]|uniref:tRNA 5-methylaminomethyl-2-thiouridine biosynthesis bifunctional protein MnmC n=1 Tax=Ferrimonas pelagia TaxID=1177826 RepID=A0ABP9E8N5_9GAMM
MSHLTPANIDWSDPAAPLSTQFGDFYFSKKNGAAETEYVFLHHNHLPGRWQQHQQSLFTVAETGFGTGLNFFVLWRHFQQFRRQHPSAACQRLHFVSVEKYPLNVDDLRRAHGQWPEFADLAMQLRQHYPPATQGCHRLLLDNGQIVLDLWFGDVLDTLPQMDAGRNGVVDAWFLDGFTPRKNPQMWQPALYQHMVRLSRPGGSFATFTAASDVRRGLQAAGYQVKKAKGFMGKREMIYGTLPMDSDAADSDARSRELEPVSIVGGGMAAASTALALCRRGVQVDLYCADDAPAQGASGSRQGALYPLLNAGGDALSQFYSQAFPLARQSLLQLAEQHTIHHGLSGVLQLPVDDRSRDKIRKLAGSGLPSELVQGVSAKQGSELAGVPIDRDGVYYPQGAWICPKDLTLAMLAEAERTGLLSCHYQHPLQALHCDQGRWLLDFGHRTAHAPQVVLAMGASSAGLAATAPLQLNPVRGQTSYPEAQDDTAKLQTVLCADGYLVPSMDGRLTCGASFVRGDDNTDWREADRDEIRQRMTRSFGALAWHTQLELDDSGRAAVRATVRDHLPLAGPVLDWDNTQDGMTPAQTRCQPGLYLLSGLGSRGLCSASLCAELLASQLLEEPRPLSGDQQARLAPGRFWLRRLAKGQPLLHGPLPDNASK